MQKIIFVSHCICNTASKVVLFNKDEIEAEEALRRRFLLHAVENGIQIVQLPCPEFTLYGSKRWGHVSNQFDNPFFRKHCSDILEPFILQLEEYLAHPEMFQVLGIIGIDGSPSCGVSFTCSSDEWFGSFECRKDTLNALESVTLESNKGIFMDVLSKRLEEKKIPVPIVGLYAGEPERIFRIMEMCELDSSLR
jgi:predicted secreted protein